MFEIFVRLETCDAVPGNVVVAEPISDPAVTLTNIGTVITTPVLRTTFKLKLTTVSIGIERL